MRHREGYRDKRSDVLFSEGSVAALQYGVERNDLGVRLELGRAERRADGNYLLPLLIKIPLAGVTLAPGESEYFGRVRVATGVKDADDKISPVQVHESATIRVPNERFEEAQDKYWTYELQLVMNGGRQRLAVGVHDELGAQSAFLSVPVDPAATG